jgi:ATP-dependent Clp protease ATP-binding subunit ClpC
VYARFTERAREVIVLAQDAARGLGHQEIGTEHLLLGLLAEREGIAAWTLRSLGIDVVRAHDEVMRIEGAGPEETRGQIPLTYHAKRVVDFATTESDRRAAGFVGTEHILLGLLAQLDSDADNDVAGQVLSAAEISRSSIRKAIDRPGEQPT